MGTGGACFCHSRSQGIDLALIPLVGFEEPLATSEIHLGEKSAEKKKNSYSLFLIFLFIHRNPLYRAANQSRREGGLQVMLDTSSAGGTSR